MCVEAEVFKQHNSQSRAKMDFWVQEQGKGFREQQEDTSAARDHFLAAARMVWFIMCSHQFIFDQ